MMEADEWNRGFYSSFLLDRDDVYIEHSGVTFIEEFPEGLIDISVGNNLFTSLPDLPSTTQSLACEDNPYLETLPRLNEGLTRVIAYKTAIHTLPELPSTLKILNIKYTKVRSLPDLPPSLQTLICDFDKLDDASKCYYLIRFGKKNYVHPSGVDLP